MMKLGFHEAVHGNLNMMIRPHVHESWDYPNHVGSSSFPKPPIDDTHNENTNINLAPSSSQNENELSDWVEHFAKHLVDDLPAPDNYEHSLSSPILNPRKAINNIQTSPCCNIHDELNLLTLLMECAAAISVDNLSEAHTMLLELTQLASPYKPSCAERVVAYFAQAMASRVMNSWLGIFSPLVDHRTIHSSFQVFSNISPFIKFAHFTSNQAILEALHRYDAVHIIDLDIMQGLQWPAFFHILATTRFDGPPRVRMTGMGSSIDLLVETGKQLTNYAKRLGMSFHFQPVARKFGEIEDISTTLRISPHETLAVHWLQHSLYDATGPDWNTLRLLEQLEPRIVTLVEQDVSNGGSFLDRFVGSLHYYSSLFDSLGAYINSEDPNRHKVEHGLLYREINNILAIGGPARSGEDKYRNWRSELARHCNFVQVPMSPNSMAQAQLILNSFSPPHGYTLAQVDGILRLGWKHTSLYSASAWTYSSPTSKII